VTKKKEFVPTPGQKSAIEARGQNILVNAGAGAGKTSTLTRRVMERLLEEGADVSLENLVIVTFTRAAAAEMRERIGETLRDKLVSLDDSQEQLAKRLDAEIQSLPRAQISTLHSYCSTLLREFGDRVGLPPDFDLIDEDEAMLLHQERVRDEIERLAGDPEDGPLIREMLQQLSPTTGARELENLALRLQLFLDSLDDPEGFVKDALVAYDLVLQVEDPRKSQLLRLRHEILRDGGDAIRRLLATFLDDTKHLKLTTPSRNKLHQAVQERWRDLEDIIQADDVEPLVGIFLESPFLPPNSNPGNQEDNVEHHRLAKVLKERLDEDLKECKGVAELGTIEEIRENIEKSAPFVRLFLTRLGLDMLRSATAEHVEMRRLRFSDLERLTLRLLETAEGKPTEVAEAIRNRTTEVLVDEFQDVNALQARLLKAIARPAEDPRGGNLFVVGDLKQSIYGFRQADPRKFKQMYDAYQRFDPRTIARPGGRIDLVENYRSHPMLLGLFNEFFAGLFSERIGQLTFDASHQFSPGLSGTGATPRTPFVDVLILEKGDAANADAEDAASQGLDDTNNVEDDLSMEQYEKEAVVVAQEILRLKEEGVSLGDIAVLTRSGRAAATKLAEVFQHLGIMYHTEAATGFLQQQEVIDFKALLRVLDNPFEDVALVGALRSPLAEWSEDELAALRLVDRNASLWENLRRLATAEDDLPLSTAARNFLERTDRWRETSRRKPMGELFALIMEETNWCPIVAALPNGDMRVNNLLYLVERAVQFDGFQRKGLSQFLHFLEELEANEKDLGSPPSVAPAADLVRIMTIHKSKGLEFSVVIIPFLGSGFNDTDLKRRLLWDRDVGVASRFLRGAAWGDDEKSAACVLLKRGLRDKLLSEELRLLYVAMTRAKSQLLLVGTAKPSKDYTVRGLLARQAEEFKNGGESWRTAQAARASCFMDWVRLGFIHRAEMANPGDAESDAAKSFRVRLIPESEAIAGAGIEKESKTDRAKRAEAELEANRSVIDQMISRVNALSALGDAPSLKVKVTATEAKRIWQAEQFTDEDAEFNVAWSTRRTAATSTSQKDSLPDWWPDSLKESGPRGGKHRGTINHLFLENVDLSRLATGDSIEDEVARLVSEGIIDPRDEAELLVEELGNIFTLDPLGPELLKRHATVRREVPFRIGIPACDLLQDPSASRELIMLQGVIDLIYEDDAGRLVIVDWKTDRCDGSQQDIDRLTAAYRPQILLYAEGLRRATGREIAKAWLVFIQAGQPVGVECRRDSNEWLQIVKPAVIAGDSGDRLSSSH
jgi:ATP-dependent helicase/nuclease subunit A